MTTPRRNLVIAAVGDDSWRHTWFMGAGRRFYDVALAYYGDQAPPEEAEFRIARKGFKFTLLADLLDELGPRVAAYDHIWAPDDDIASSVEDINRLFEIAWAYDLPISQPAIAQGDVSYAALRRREDLLLRYTGFVEVMCPLFSREALEVVRPTFRETVSGWGIDWAWTRLVDRRRLAVIDSVGVRHMRPLDGAASHRRATKAGVSPAEECRRVLAKYGLRGPKEKWLRSDLKHGTNTCDAVDLGGRRTQVGPSFWARWSRSA